MKISIDVDVLNAIASDARKANSECQKAYQIINMVTKGTAWLCREKDDINDNLKSLNKQINNLSEDFSVFAITADSVATNFRDYVYSIDKKYLKDMKSMIGIFGFAAGEVTNIATNVGRKTQILMSELSNKVYGKLFNLNTASIVAACTIPGTIVPFATLNMGQHQGSSLANSLINTHNNTPNNVTVTTAADIEQINQSATPPSYQIPNYVKEDPNLKPDDNGYYNPRVKHKDGTSWSESIINQDGGLSCTYYTLRKLKERQLGFPCIKGPGAGFQWVSAFDNDVKCPISRNGNNSLQDLIDKYNIPQDNVVISFDAEPSNAAKINNGGHVLLIDHVRRNADGEVELVFSEMNKITTSAGKSYGERLYGQNAKNTPITVTLEEFKKIYGKRTMNGAVALGKGVGDY